MTTDGEGKKGNSSLPSAETIPSIETRRLALEKYKIRLEYRKFVLSSVFVAIAIALIPPLFQLATALLEYVKSEAKLRNEQEVFRQTYVKEFMSNALNQDIELRIRLAEYFAHVSVDSVRQGWTNYHSELVKHREQIRTGIDSLEAQWQKAQETKPRNDSEIGRLERNLSWHYKEVGYVEKDRSVTANPRTRIPDDFNQSANNSLPSEALTDAEKSIVAACKENKVTDAAQLAYILATVRWETAQTFKPVYEAFWLSDAFRRTLPYFPYYARGYIPLVWKKNYEEMGKVLNVDLLNEPEKALEPQLAAQIACVAFRDGSLTGRKLSDFVTENSPDFVSARRVINGTDRANEIAAIATQYFSKRKQIDSVK